MNQPYIFESSKNKKFDSDEAIVMLPDIYCQTDYSKSTAEQFAETFARPVFMLDYFFLSTGVTNSFAQDDKETVRELMQNFNANQFVTFFGKVLDEIKEEYPAIKQFVVIGFCFGGRLAYIAGGEKTVSKVFSFYGAGANTIDYVDSQTPVEYLVSKRKNDPLTIISFFGMSDQTIPETDRHIIDDTLTQGGIAYKGYEYDAGHAYFQEGRANYNSLASQASWEVLKQNM